MPEHVDTSSSAPGHLGVVLRELKECAFYFAPKHGFSSRSVLAARGFSCASCVFFLRLDVSLRTVYIFSCSKPGLPHAAVWLLRVLAFAVCTRLRRLILHIQLDPISIAEVLALLASILAVRGLSSASSWFFWVRVKGLVPLFRCAKPGFSSVAIRPRECNFLCCAVASLCHLSLHIQFYLR